MSHLIQLRQRIKAIETIQKITHAMRLISMATHTRLKTRHIPVSRYKDSIQGIFKRLSQHAPEWTNPIFYPTPHTNPQYLYILISSNKGLCGSFNTQLFTRLNRSELHLKQPRVYFILIGRQAIEYDHGIADENIILKQSDITVHSIDSITQECTALIMKNQFCQVSIISNIVKTFFKQEAHETIIIPYEQYNREPVIEYAWEQPLVTMLPLIAEQYLQAQIYQAVFESLYAEQAARFLSMDTATRNAHTLLEETRVQYNKMRQLKITKELIELIGGL